MHGENSLIYRAWKKYWESLLLLIFVAIAFALKKIILGGRWNITGSMLTSLKFTPALQHDIVREGLGLCVRKIVQSTPLLGQLGPDFPYFFAFVSFPPLPLSRPLMSEFPMSASCAPVLSSYLCPVH